MRSHEQDRARAAMRWLLGGALMLAVLLDAARPWSAYVQPAGQPGEARLSFAPVASASVSLGEASARRAGATDLWVGRQPVSLSYLQFDVRGVGPGGVRRATLLLYTYDDSPAGFAVQSVDGPWPEGELTFSNRPRAGQVVAVSGGQRAAALAAADVTGYVTGDGLFSLAISSTSDRPLRYAGPGAAGHAPRLILQLGEASAAPTAQPTTQPAPTSPTAARTQSTAPTASADVLQCSVRNLAWTVPGQLLRGGSPSAEGITCLAQAGVGVIVDQRLPSEDKINEPELARRAGLEYVNLGVPDDTAPSPDVLAQWFNAANAALAQGKVVLVHDAGGRGRMGFWAAAYLMRHGVSPQQAIDGHYVGTALAFPGAKIDCPNGGNGQVQGLAEIAQVLTGQAYYPSADRYGHTWQNCPRPGYMDGWNYAAALGR